MRPWPLLLAAALAASGTFAATAAPFPTSWTGTIVVPKTKLAPRAYSSFELKIFSTTSDEEVAKLGEAFRTGGQAKLRELMFATKQIGWIRIGDSVATEIGIIRAHDLPEGSRRVRIYSDHPLRLLDKSDPPGSDLHPFGFMEMTVDAQGNGSGRLVAAASLEVVDGDLTLQSAGLDVIELRDVVASSSTP
jgi:hypothetical protein